MQLAFNLRIFLMCSIYGKGGLMKKSFFIVLMLAILSTPLVVMGIISIMRVKPEASQPVNEFPMAEIETTPTTPSEAQPATPNSPATGVPTQPVIPSATFMTGYWDGWHGKWLGPIRWTLSDDYRQGHMLGSYDRRNGIDRYPSPK